jgi:hypothetical protein
LLGDVLDGNVRAGEEQSFVTVRVPTHDVRRLPLLTLDLDDFPVPFDLSHLPAMYDEAVTDGCVHLTGPPFKRRSALTAFSDHLITARALLSLPQMTFRRVGRGHRPAHP